ncbi:hypothetical protein SDRG_13463 [Saprolegnia diclina VS20]|uniref:Ankyrin repeat-containing domain n=1 Tax=Saprolegnia diclina (strain VS20) TaxID=1156394 RepID=T0Q5R5_SAPDV|nr:hypothetical protein SDRG_13463 [Saprolegnia diclina VS20]EQC28780.1 hypothetical protein SDRG_13463 [Saprolegnia diclina VS20]|eukprot:XP_008617775.1 hypothetical protein SDRG_13463 [Saprolegnia diclina VS20]
MPHLAAHVLRAPSLLKRICTFHIDASAKAPALPQRCCSIRLRSTYKLDDDGNDDVAVNGQRGSMWSLVLGDRCLPLLCEPHLFAHAIARGDANILGWLISQGRVAWTKELLMFTTDERYACPGAKHDLGGAMTMRALHCVARAAEKGHLAVLQLLHANGSSMGDVWQFVCSGGHVNVARYVVTHDLGVWNDAFINTVAEKSLVDLLHFLLRRSYGGVNQRTLALAIQHNQLQSVRDLFAHKHCLAPLSFEDALRDAVEYDRLDILRWLCNQARRTCLLGRGAGNGDVLLRVGCCRMHQCRHEPARQQAAYPLRVAVQALYCSEQQSRCVPEMQSFALFHEQFGGWLARHDLSQLDQLCQPHLFAYALSYGNMEILEELDVEFRASHQHVQLNGLGCRPCCVGQLDKLTYQNVVQHATESGHFDLLAHLEDVGFAMDDVWYRVSFFGDLEIARYAHECEFDGWLPRYVYNAAASGHLGLIKFLDKHHFSGFDSETICGAVHSGNLALVDYLLTHRTEGTLRKALKTAAETANLKMLCHLVGRPGVSCAEWRAYVTRSHACAAYLTDVMRVRTSRTRIYKQSLKRKASEMT